MVAGSSGDMEMGKGRLHVVCSVGALETSLRDWVCCGNRGSVEGLEAGYLV